MIDYSYLRVPSSHPYVAATAIDPADYRAVTKLIEQRAELRLVHCDMQHPDEWTLYVGAASRRAKGDFEDWAAGLSA